MQNALPNITRILKKTDVNTVKAKLKKNIRIVVIAAMLQVFQVICFIALISSVLLCFVQIVLSTGINLMRVL